MSFLRPEILKKFWEFESNQRCLKRGEYYFVPSQAGISTLLPGLQFIIVGKVYKETHRKPWYNQFNFLENGFLRGVLNNRLYHLLNIVSQLWARWDCFYDGNKLSNILSLEKYLIQNVYQNTQKSVLIFSNERSAIT